MCYRKHLLQSTDASKACNCSDSFPLNFTSRSLRAKVGIASIKLSDTERRKKLYRRHEHVQALQSLLYFFFFVSFSLEGSEEKEVCGEEEVVEEMNKKKHIEAIWEKRREKNC